MDAGDVIIQKVVTLLEGEVNTDAGHHLRLLLAALQRAEELGGKTGATSQLRDALASAH